LFDIHACFQVAKQAALSLVPVANQFGIQLHDHPSYHTDDNYYKYFVSIIPPFRFGGRFIRS